MCHMDDSSANRAPVQGLSTVQTQCMPTHKTQIKLAHALSLSHTHTHTHPVRTQTVEQKHTQGTHP